ncbi:MAG: NAD-dependent epimerase/dehydratase family protein [Deltaproteobacteria bacterium]|nr:NAD-dependent epimerase/dehydratase family protein [Deltaproteobacteria bacterium]
MISSSVDTVRYKKALVTGGAGFIGSHLCKGLVAEGLEVNVLDNLSTGKPENLPDQAVLLRGDIRNPGDVKAALEGVDVVFHLAAKVSIRASVDEFLEDADQNIMGALNVLQSLKGSRVKKFLLASSMAVYADSPDATPVPENHSLAPASPYGVAKLAAEAYTFLVCRQLGIDALVLRYFNTYGTNQTFTPYVGVITIFTKLLLQGKVPAIFGDGCQMRDFVSVRDIVQANILAMKRPLTGRIYNVGTGVPHSVNQVAELLAQQINPAIQPVHQPEVAGELKNSIASIAAISRDLGYQPTSNLKADLGEVIQSIQSTL